MNELVNSFLSYQKQLSDKESKKHHITSILQLLDKLEDKDVDEELKKSFQELLVILGHNSHDKALHKEYEKTWVRIKAKVKEQYGFIEKGEIVGEYMSYGVAFGLLIGVAFLSLNSAYIAIGLPIGIGVGLALGESKEKRLDERGLLF